MQPRRRRVAAVAARAVRLQLIDPVQRHIETVPTFVFDHRAIEGAPDDRGPILGKAALRAYIQDWIDTFHEFRIEPVELIELDDDRVVAVMRFGGRAKLSGVETDSTLGVIFTIRHGMIARGREYATREEALEAAGLRE